MLYLGGQKGSKNSNRREKKKKLRYFFNTYFPEQTLKSHRKIDCSCFPTRQSKPLEIWHSKIVCTNYSMVVCNSSTWQILVLLKFTIYRSSFPKKARPLDDELLFLMGFIRWGRGSLVDLASTKEIWKLRTMFDLQQILRMLWVRQPVDCVFNEMLISNKHLKDVPFCKAYCSGKRDLQITKKLATSSNDSEILFEKGFISYLFTSFVYVS